MRKTKRGWGEAVGSLICFGAVVGTLIAVDDRVRDRVAAEVSANRLSAWPDRALALATVLIDVARDQSIEHAPLVVFSVVALVLVLFMMRT